MLRAVIFDFDGVITDSEILHFRGFNHVLAQYNAKITTKDYYKHYLGLTDLDLFKLLADNGVINVNEQDILKLAEQKKHIFEEMAETEGSIIEGVRDFLELLKSNNIPIAIYSGALLPEIELILQQGRLRSFFEVIVSAEHVKRAKPHPEGFLLALQKLNEKKQPPITAGQCIVIEDSHWGLKAAKAAGMRTIAVTNSYDADQLTLGETIVTDLRQLTIPQLHQLCD